MTRYQLAKLIDISGKITSRKRIQKTVQLLQAAGCDFGVEFVLHHYGPYSFELASLLDDMAACGILEESEESVRGGKRYSYRLSDPARASMIDYEVNLPAIEAGEQFDLFSGKLDLLNSISELWTLELGSTISHFYQECKDWAVATKQACDFKNVSIDADSTASALRLAKAMAS